MPMELRKRKAPAAPAASAPAPKRKATTTKKEKKPVAPAPKAAEKKKEPATVVKKVALPKKADKAEVTTEAPTATADPEVLPEAPVAESSKAKPAAKAKPAKETKAAKAAEPAKKEEKKEEKTKEKKAPVAPKEKKEKTPAEKPATKSKEKAPAEVTKPAAEKKTETASDKKEKKPATTKASSSKSATATPAPPAGGDLKQGDPIPSDLPEITNQAGEKVALSSLLDASETGIVIFAYPAASTPGCTRQAIGFNESKETFEAQGYSIYGLSGDKPEKNLKFKEARELTYPLLSDVTYEFQAKFGIAKPGGKGTLRSVIVLSKDGKVITLKKAGPEETVKAARAACGISADVKQAEKSETDKEKKGAADIASKQPTVEEAPDSTT